MDHVSANRMGQVETELNERALGNLIDFKGGITDIACPICGPGARAESNRRRRVLRVWNNQGFITYKCARCGSAGWLRGDNPFPATPLPPKDNSARKALAERLWGQSLAVHNSPVEVYLRLRKCYAYSHAIRYLPARDRYHPTMICKYQGTSAVHLTRLRPDGMGKAGTDHDKLMIGPVSGFPIVIRSNQWSKPLLICEGIEDGLSLSLAYPQWTVWAAGSASMIPKLVKVADKLVMIAVDDDMAGEKAAEKSISINSETKVLRFKKGLDPNAILVQHGLNALKESVTRHQPFHR